MNEMKNIKTENYIAFKKLLNYLTIFAQTYEEENLLEGDFVNLITELEDVKKIYPSIEDEVKLVEGTIDKILNPCGFDRVRNINNRIGKYRNEILKKLEPITEHLKENSPERTIDENTEHDITFLLKTYRLKEKRLNEELEKAHERYERILNSEKRLTVEAFTSEAYENLVPEFKGILESLDHMPIISVEYPEEITMIREKLEDAKSVYAITNFLEAKGIFETMIGKIKLDLNIDEKDISPEKIVLVKVPKLKAPEYKPILDKITLLKSGVEENFWKDINSEMKKLAKMLDNFGFEERLKEHENFYGIFNKKYRRTETFEPKDKELYKSFLDELQGDVTEVLEEEKFFIEE